MRKIQLITFDNNKYSSSTRIVVSHFSCPMSLDEFDINVIDLSSSSIWCSQQSTHTVDVINDFISLQKMVNNKHNTIVMYVLPQNKKFHYDLTYREDSGAFLKDNLEDINKDILPKVFPSNIFHTCLVFENTRTRIGELLFEADFYFSSGITVTKSEKSEKPTTINLDNSKCFATTLKIMGSEENILNFIDNIFPETDNNEAPHWADKLLFHTDKQCKSAIQNAEEKIKELQVIIDNANTELERNNHFKSILYTNSDELVTVVFEILEEILECNLSEFVDEKKEDFLIIKDNCTFIGEIKGVTSNIRSENISQLDVHYQGYKDKLDEENRSENVFQLLIMNPFRKKAPYEREPIADTQIKLAHRNNCLIITTETLLKIYELFLENRITSSECITIFSNTTGLLSLENFEQVKE